MFLDYPAYPRYRTLELLDPYLQGEDVYALQTALTAAGYETGAYDGRFGPKTSDAVTMAQKNLFLFVDGKAGGNTQRGLALVHASLMTAKYALAKGALKGQLEFESGYRLGNYSPVRSNGSFDAGVAQRNTELTAPPQGFDVPNSVDALGRRVRDYYDLFKGVGKTRRWGLAQGAWNAPAFACYLANEEGASVPRNQTLQPTSSQRATFEQYIAHVTTYLNV